jgi:hypothetical protein
MIAAAVTRADGKPENCLGTHNWHHVSPQARREILLEKRNMGALLDDAWPMVLGWLVAHAAFWAGWFCAFAAAAWTDTRKD